ncbi:MAG: DMT family transporter [Pseudomonadota bacterium]
MTRPMDATAWAMLLALSLLWGGSFLFIGIAVGALPPLTIVVLRVGFAALALWAFLWLTGIALPRGRTAWTALIGMGVLNNVIPFTLIVWGQTQIASGLASILNATTPIFTVVVAHWLTSDEPLTRVRALGVGLGFAGVVAMIGWDALDGLGASVPAQLAVLGAALSYAFASVFARRFRTLGLAPEATAAGQVTASALLLAPLALVIERPWTLPPPPIEVIGAVLALALASTALAYGLYFRILARAGATNLMLVTFLIPPSAIALGWLVLDERLVWVQGVGLLLILAGLACIDGRLLARRRAQPGGQSA